MCPRAGKDGRGGMNGGVVVFYEEGFYSGRGRVAEIVVSKIVEWRRGKITLQLFSNNWGVN